MHTQSVANQSGAINASIARNAASKLAEVASTQKTGGGEEANETGADNETNEQGGSSVDQVSISQVAKNRASSQARFF